jgi:hypothetical protein
MERRNVEAANDHYRGRFGTTPTNGRSIAHASLATPARTCC